MCQPKVQKCLHKPAVSCKIWICFLSSCLYTLSMMQHKRGASLFDVNVTVGVHYSLSTSSSYKAQKWHGSYSISYTQHAHNLSKYLKRIEISLFIQWFNHLCSTISLQDTYIYICVFVGQSSNCCTMNRS